MGFDVWTNNNDEFVFFHYGTLELVADDLREDTAVYFESNDDNTSVNELIKYVLIELLGPLRFS